MLPCKDSYYENVYNSTTYNSQKSKKLKCPSTGEWTVIKCGIFMQQNTICQ